MNMLTVCGVRRQIMKMDMIDLRCGCEMGQRGVSGAYTHDDTSWRMIMECPRCKAAWMWGRR